MGCSTTSVMLQHNRACAARRTLRILQHIPNSRRTRASWGRIQPPVRPLHISIASSLLLFPPIPRARTSTGAESGGLFITGVARPGPIPMLALQRGAGAASPAAAARSSFAHRYPTDVTRRQNGAGIKAVAAAARQGAGMRRKVKGNSRTRRIWGSLGTRGGCEDGAGRLRGHPVSWNAGVTAASCE